MKIDRPAVRLRLVLRELQQVQRALDVDLVRRERRELRARGEQRREVEDQLDLELGEHALEQRPIENRPGDLAIDHRRDRRVEPGEVEGDDGAVATAPASRSIRPWPISPPAPVISTTGFRTREIILKPS